MKKLALAFVTLTGLTAASFAAVRTQTVTYKQGDTTLEGYLAFDDSKTGKRPGILVVHEWMGINEFTKKKTEALASLGYVAFAADIYGKGVRPTTPEDAGKQSSLYKNDRKLMRARAAAGLEILQKNPLVDSTKLAAIGYCFGGTTALELARSGAQLSGIVVFHGGLSTPTPEDAKNIKGKVLALQGGDDPYVPQAERDAFIEEMRNGHVDWQLVQYSNTVHAYTNPDAGGDNSKGAAYNKQSAERAWVAMKNFFAEIFS